MNDWIVTIGLLLDLFGALVLIAYQFTVKAHIDDDLIIKVYGNGWYTQRKHVRQRQQTVTGFSILGTGFLLQAIGSNTMLYESMSKLNDPQILGLLISFIGAFHISAAVFWMRYKNFRKTFHGDNKGMSMDLTDLEYKQSRKTLLGFLVFSVGILFQITDYFFLTFALPAIATILSLILAIGIPPIMGLFLFRDDRLKKLEDKAAQEEIAEEQAEKSAG